MEGIMNIDGRDGQVSAALTRYRGDGDARCGDCVIDTLEANPGMNPADWLDDELGETACDVCDATVVKVVSK
jgi:hypothetical protein